MRRTFFYTVSGKAESDYVWFGAHSNAIALFPSGLGTDDVGFAALTLLQTGKRQPKPLIFVDRPNGNY